MSRDLLRGAMPFSTVGRTPRRWIFVCGVYYPRHSAQLYCLPRPTVQTATAGIGPAETKIRRTLLAVEAALPLKSP